jgi:hypothetical protein
MSADDPRTEVVDPFVSAPLSRVGGADGGVGLSAGVGPVQGFKGQASTQTPAHCLKIRYLDIKMKRWELRASAEGMTHGISSN